MVNIFYLNTKTRYINWFSKDEFDINNKKFIGSIKMNNLDKHEIELWIDTHNYNAIISDTNFEHQQVYQFTNKHMSILKSNLQKCVRREDSITALKTIISLIHMPMGLFEALRRLSIIIIEDAVLIREYAVLIWFMCAITKGMPMTEICIEWIVDIMNNVFNSKRRDHLYKYIKVPDDPTIIWYDILNSSIDTKDRDLLLSLFFRASFKGMECDQKMLYKSIILWKQRMENNDRSLKFLDLNSHRPIPLDIFRGIHPTELLLEAFDYHCTDIVDKIRELVNFDKKYIKKLIWNYNSSINTRVDIDHNSIIINDKMRKVDKANWEIIKRIFTIETINMRKKIIDS